MNKTANLNLYGSHADVLWERKENRRLLPEAKFKFTTANNKGNGWLQKLRPSPVPRKKKNQ